MSLRVRLGTVVGYAIGYVICEPQKRLGRRRHDNHCDECGRDCGSYAMEKLDFDFGADDVEDHSTLENLKCMFNAEYARYCLECATEIEE